MELQQSELAKGPTTKKYSARKKPRRAAAVPAKIDKEEAMIKIISAINLLILQSNASGLGTAARILHTAKEDLAYWVVSMNFYEAKQDKFINQCVYDNGMSALISMLSKFSDTNKLDLTQLIS